MELIEMPAAVQFDAINRTVKVRDMQRLGAITLILQRCLLISCKTLIIVLLCASSLGWAPVTSAATTNELHLVGDQPVTFAQHMYRFGLERGAEDAASGIQYATSDATLPLLNDTTPIAVQHIYLIKEYLAASKAQQEASFQQFTLGYNKSRGVAASSTNVPPASALSPELTHLGQALLKYVASSQDRLPNMTTVQALDTALSSYLDSTTDTIDPTSHTPFLPNAEISSLDYKSFGNPSAVVAIVEPGPNADGSQLLLMLDGSVTRFYASQSPPATVPGASGPPSPARNPLNPSMPVVTPGSIFLQDIGYGGKTLGTSYWDVSGANGFLVTNSTPRGWSVTTTDIPGSAVQFLTVYVPAGTAGGDYTATQVQRSVTDPGTSNGSGFTFYVSTQ